MKKIILSVLVTVFVILLFFTSFALGVMDGCQDAGFNTFAVGKHGIYCFDSAFLSPYDAPILDSGDL